MTANTDTKQEIEDISSFVFNFPLAESLFQSIESGLRKQTVHFAGGNTVWYPLGIDSKKMLWTEDIPVKRS